MSFTDLPPQPSMSPRADNYAETSLRLSQLAQLQTRTALDLAYGDDYWQRLDIYLPPASAGTGLPVFINIHGGGWTHGYKEWFGLMAPAIVAFPAIYISLNYRLAGTAQHPAQMEDCLAATAWVHRNIHLFGGDANRIFIGGHSAGGHLAALVTLRRDLHAKFGLPANVIKACFPVSGVYYTQEPGPNGALENATIISPIIGSAADLHDAAPANFTAGNTTPFYVTWSENDNPFCLRQGPWFADLLAREKGRVERHCFPLFDHFSIAIDTQRPDNLWTRTLKAWMAGDPNTATV